jgi:UDP-glucose-4-epimerase GalE
MNILVCGGAGYIGAHMCKMLAKNGHAPIAFDNLSTGHDWAVKWGPLVRGDLLDPAALAIAFREHRIDAVMHFAARSLVGESMREPGLYFRNNVAGTLNLLDAMRAAAVGKLVFSSTAAVYGDPVYTPIDEAHPCAPINPYGWSKLMAERAIAEYCRAHGLRAVALRYFNAAGADASGQIGEAHEPETHLIPLAIAAALGEGKPLTVFGLDYDTPDGACLRDYIHVSDLAAAHVAALKAQLPAGAFEAANVGTGQGRSVLEVVDAVGRAVGKPVPHSIGARRAGDPPSLVADPSRAASLLGWRAERSGLDQIVADALRWESNPRYGAGHRAPAQRPSAVSSE